MTKHNFSTDMAAHVWAQQSQAAGTGGKGSVYFEGPALYSYGSHFLTGYITEPGTVLLNADKYSATTSKHQSDAWGATRHMRQFQVPGLSDLRDPLRWRVNSADYVSIRSKIMVREWLRSHAQELLSEDTWRGSSPHDSALYIAGLFGLTAANVAAEIKRGIAAAEKAKRDVATRQRSDMISAATLLADMTDEQFSEHLSERAYVHDPSSFSGVGQMGENVARCAKQLSTMARLGAGVLGKRRVATLKARRAALLAWAEGMPARVIAADKAAALATFQAWRERWRAAEDDVARFAAMANAPKSWRYHDGGRATVISERDLAELQTAEQWARDHEAERRAMLAEIKEREAAERRQRDAATFAEWQAGESVQCPASYHSTPRGGAYVRRRGDYLETSQGASVPWAHAVRVFKFVKLCRERGEAWRTNGRVVRVGHFTVSEITAEGDMRAGCHFFEWAQIEALARAQGVYDAEPSAEAVEARQ